jgi:hypothetical protein
VCHKANLTLPTFLRFYLNPKVTSPSPTIWMVPISFAYPHFKRSDYVGTTPEAWMTKSKLNIDLKERPYIINVQQTGSCIIKNFIRIYKTMRKVGQVGEAIQI